MSMLSSFKNATTTVCVALCLAGTARAEEPLKSASQNQTAETASITFDAGIAEETLRLPSDDPTPNCAVITMTSSPLGDLLAISDPVLTEKEAAAIVRANRSLFNGKTAHQMVNCGEISRKEWLCLATANELYTLWAGTMKRTTFIKAGTKSTAPFCGL